jgi:magnesium transporter
MSESDDIAVPARSAPPPPETDLRLVMDADDRLRPDFVARVLDAVEAGDNATARALVEPLHPADVADLIELAARDEREGLVKALAGIISPDVVGELND